MTATTAGWRVRAARRARLWYRRATYRRTDVSDDPRIQETYILRLALRLGDLAALLSPINWAFGTRDWIADLDPALAASARHRRAKAIDVTILVSLTGMTGGLAAIAMPIPTWARLGLVVLILVRLIDIMQAAVAMTLFDPIRAPSQPLVHTSIARVFVNSGANFLEIWLGFSVLSLCVAEAYDPALTGPADALFHGFTTQFALGSPYLPSGWPSQGVTVAHMAATFVFVVLVIGRWLTALTSAAETNAAPSGQTRSSHGE